VSNSKAGRVSGARFWIVLALPFAVAGRATSDVLSDVFLSFAGLFGLLAAVNLALLDRTWPWWLEQ
jgi:hypothetical protein